MEYKIGDPVVHWSYGFGHVVGIEERVISGQKALYYAVSVGELTVWVPADDQLQARLRPPTSKRAFKDLFAILSGVADPLPDDRQERRLWLLEKLKDGQAGSLCRVLRALAAFQHVHSLNDNDQVLMKRTRTALLGEWIYSLSVPLAEAETELHRMLAIGVSAETGSH